MLNPQQACLLEIRQLVSNPNIKFLGLDFGTSNNIYISSVDGDGFGSILTTSSTSM